MSNFSLRLRSAGMRVQRQRVWRTAGCVLGLIVVASALVAPGYVRAAGVPEIETVEGPIQGFAKGGVNEFLGVPYAQPPVGDMRWRPPVTHAPWTGVLQAKAFGPACAQVTTLGVFAGPANENEDCLYLNVFMPNVPPFAGQKLPVLVWIHGGGLFDGASNDYDATALATKGPMVVVTLNYRLGLFGFLAHPALDGDGHPFANYGLLDQQASLAWVNRNIDRFGGDKNNVTLAGQSAGARSVIANLTSPFAKNLFQRAILESGGYAGFAPLPFAESKGRDFAVAAGCGSGASPTVAKCLRALPAARVMALSGTASVNAPYVTGFIVDGEVLPLREMGALQGGHFNHVPVLNGSVRDEGNFFIAISEYFSGPPRMARGKADYDTAVTKIYKGNAGPLGSPPAYPTGTVKKVLAQYPVDAYASPQLALSAVLTDPMVCRARHLNQILAGQVPVYAYEFDDRTAPAYFPEMPGFVPYAYHTSDLQYLFPLYHGGNAGVSHPLSPRQRALSDQIVAGWANFARTGNPNGTAGRPWPRFENKPTRPAYLSENIPALSTLSDEQYSARHHCEFWEKDLTY